MCILFYENISCEVFCVGLDELSLCFSCALYIQRGDRFGKAAVLLVLADFYLNFLL